MRSERERKENLFLELKKSDYFIYVTRIKKKQGKLAIFFTISGNWLSLSMTRSRTVDVAARSRFKKRQVNTLRT